MEYYPVCLCHYGVKGMKWGIRKSRKKKKSSKISRYFATANEKTNAFSNKVKSMSDDELTNQIRRLNLENQYIEQYNRRNNNDGVVYVNMAIKHLDKTNRVIGGVAKLITSGKQITDGLGLTNKGKKK